MRILLFILFILTTAGTLLLLKNADTAMDDIAGLILLVIASIFLTGAGIVDTLHKIHKNLLDNK